MNSALPASIAQALRTIAAVASVGNGTTTTSAAQPPLPPTQATATATATAAPTPAPTPAPTATPATNPGAAPSSAPTPAPAAPAGWLSHATLFEDVASFGGHAASIVDRLTRDRETAGQAPLTGTLRVGAGIEVRATADLRVSDDLLLSTPSAASAAAPALTLRARGTLSLTHSLAGGFTGHTASAGLAAGDGATLRLVAGADADAADPTTTRAQASGADLLIGRAAASATAALPNVLLRSTTGDLDLAAAGRVQLLNSAVKVYTTGVPLDNTLLPGWSRLGIASNQMLAAGGKSVGPFFSGAGDVRLRAGGDVVGSPTRQYVTDWWWRQTGLSQPGQPVAWWSRHDLFAQGVASLGGGQVLVEAGGSIVDLEVSTPSAGAAVQAATAADGSVLPAWTLRLPGGDLRVHAGGDIVSGLFNAGGASALLQSGGRIVSASDTGLGRSHPGAQIFYQDTAWTLAARGDTTIGQLTNPGLLQGVVQVTGGARTDAITGLDAGARVVATSTAGDLQFTGNRSALNPSDPRATASDAARVVPGELLLAAPVGSVDVQAPLLQRPVNDGRLTLLAGEDLTVGRITVAAASPATVAQPLARASANLALSRDWSRTTEAVPALDTSARDPVQLVAQWGDLRIEADLQSARPLRLVAGRDLRTTGSAALTLQHQGAGELSLLRAGRDIVLADNSAARLRLAGPGELLVLAGRDIDLQGSAGITTIGNQDNPRLLPSGGASITVVAGVDWGNADYNQALGNGFVLRADSLALAPFVDRLYALVAEDRAAELAAAGLTPLRAEDFARLAPALQLDEALALADPSAWRQAVAERVRSLPGQADVGADAALAAWRALDPAQRATLVDDVASTSSAWLTQTQRLARRLSGQPGLEAGEASAAWSALDSQRRSDLAPRLTLATLSTLAPPATLAGQGSTWLASLAPERLALALHDTLFDELRAAGRAAARLSGGVQRDAAYAPAYAALAQIYPGTRPGGDISLAASQIKTQQGGHIRLLAPGGGIDAGALNGNTGKKANQLGVLTVAGGHIEAMAGDDFAVNQSRVFTLARGDLLLWSSAGSIDAGRGARTVTGAPPPVYSIDSNGNVVVDTSGSFSGSGIAVLDAASVLDLYAPKGEISAGEAGIKPRGKAFVASDRLVGQIEGSQAVVGAPPAAPAGGDTAAMAAATAANPNANALAAGPNDEDDERRKRRRPRLQLLLEFLGFGGAR